MVGELTGTEKKYADAVRMRDEVRDEILPEKRQQGNKKEITRWTGALQGYERDVTKYGRQLRGEPSPSEYHSVKVGDKIIFEKKQDTLNRQQTQVQTQTINPLSSGTIPTTSSNIPSSSQMTTRQNPTLAGEDIKSGKSINISQEEYQKRYNFNYQQPTTFGERVGREVNTGTDMARSMVSGIGLGIGTWADKNVITPLFGKSQEQKQIETIDVYGKEQASLFSGLKSGGKIVMLPSETSGKLEYTGTLGLTSADTKAYDITGSKYNQAVYDYQKTSYNKQRDVDNTSVGFVLTGGVDKWASSKLKKTFLFKNYDDKIIKENTDFIVGFQSKILGAVGIKEKDGGFFMFDKKFRTGFYEGGQKGIREKPFTIGATFAVAGAITAFSGGFLAPVSGALVVSSTGANVLTGLGIGLGAVYAGSTGVRIASAKTPFERGFVSGEIVATELVPMAGGIAVGSLGAGKILNWRTERFYQKEFGLSSKETAFQMDNSKVIFKDKRANIYVSEDDAILLARGNKQVGTKNLDVDVIQYYKSDNAGFYTPTEGRQVVSYSMGKGGQSQVFRTASSGKFAETASVNNVQVDMLKGYAGRTATQRVSSFSTDITKIPFKTRVASIKTSFKGAFKNPFKIKTNFENIKSSFASKQFEAVSLSYTTEPTIITKSVGASFKLGKGTPNIGEAGFERIAFTGQKAEYWTKILSDTSSKQITLGSRGSRLIADQSFTKLKTDSSWFVSGTGKNPSTGVVRIYQASDVFGSGSNFGATMPKGSGGATFSSGKGGTSFGSSGKGGTSFGSSGTGGTSFGSSGTGGKTFSNIDLSTLKFGGIETFGTSASQTATKAISSVLPKVQPSTNVIPFRGGSSSGFAKSSVSFQPQIQSKGFIPVGTRGDGFIPTSTQSRTSIKVVNFLDNGYGYGYLKDSLTITKPTKSSFTTSSLLINKPDREQIVTPINRVIQRSSDMFDSSLKSVQAVQPISKNEFALVSAQGQALELNLQPIQKQEFKPIQVTQQQPIVQVITPPINISPFAFTPYVPLIGKNYPNVYFGNAFSKSQFKAPKYKYQPQFSAIVMGVRGKAPKTFTGMEFRPLPILKTKSKRRKK